MNRPDASAPRWQLKALGVHGILEPVELTDGAITLGRDPSCTISLNEIQYPHVSGIHARVQLRNGELHVDDLRSKNGTLVNGEKVSHRELKSGDVIELGRGGPRFAVVPEGNLVETVMTAHQSTSISTQSFTGTKIRKMKRALGIPEERQVTELLQEGARQHTARLVIVSTAIVVALIASFAYLFRTGKEEEARLEGLYQQLEEARTAFTEEQERYHREKTELSAERGRLQSSLDELRRTGEASQGELDRIRTKLEETDARLSLYDPVNLEQAKLERVSKVRLAIVFIEASIRYRHEETQRLLHVQNVAGGTEKLNFAGDGEPFSRQGWGSGFCIDPEGWILTNAHVVLGADGGQAMAPLVPDPAVEVVFSDRFRRHRAEVHRIAAQGTDDLALLKIEPFPGMPHLEDFTVERPPPPHGSDVFLFGFPLGNVALQEDRKVIASTFKGIMSRVVGGYLQVDAGVFPGNSGGPVTDADGGVIGIVTSVQNTPDGLAEEMGYVLPVARASKVWPPP